MWSRLFRFLVKNTVKTGALAVELPDGSTAFGGDAAQTPVRIRLRDQEALRAICQNPELALGECYTNGSLTIEDDNLKGMLALLLQNLSHSRRFSYLGLFWTLRNVTRRVSQFNPIKRSRKNVEHHYDLSDELYEMFLDIDRQYSCAYFKSPEDSLELAQQQKKQHIARKLLVGPGMEVLDIGSGWGGLGLTIAKEFGCNVFGVTLSSSQHRISNKRVIDENLSDQVTFSLMDYRSINRKFDRIVSVGMFEHVGAPHYREYFRNVRNMLKDDGVALIHTIGRASPPGSTNPWIRKYIFPGGYIPAMSEILHAIEKEGLYVADVEILRLHYAETIAHWYSRFMKNIDRISEMYDENFCRMWRFYLVASEMTFRYSQQVVFQFQLAKGNDSVPLTRDYLYSGN